MLRYRKYLLLFLLPFFVYFAFTPVKRDPKITKGEVIEHIKYLASDELGGRFPGTKGDSLAEAYIIKQFSSFKLKPAGEDGYRQSFNFVSEVKLAENNSFAVTGGSERTS
jgi:hypothetical protein